MKKLVLGGLVIGILFLILVQGVYAAETYQFVMKWGEPGTGNGQFNNPSDIAVDNGGNVYVADTGNNRIQKFSSNGSYLTQWGSAGTNNGQFNGPSSVAIDSSGNVYVSDSGNNRTQKFTSDGSYLTQWQPSGKLGVDGGGSVSIVQGDARIQKFSSEGVFLREFDLSIHMPGFNHIFSNIKDLAVDNGGTMNVACMYEGIGETEFVTKLTPDGFAYGRIDLDGITGIATDNEGNIYVGRGHAEMDNGPGNHRIQKYSAIGSFLTEWGSFGTGDGQFNSPRGIAIDPSGDVYVVDFTNRIQKFTKAAIANFTGTPLDGDAPLGVTFTDFSTGTGITNRSWNFGDGNVTNFTESTNPYHVYTTPGLYSVNLTVTKAGGQSSLLRAGYITVNAPQIVPVADFTGTPTSGRAPLTVSFTDLSSNNPIGWAWYFGDENYTEPWTQVNASAGWSARLSHSSVVMPNGGIVLMGGLIGNVYKNDVWRSTDNGATWTQVNANAGWTARGYHSSVVLPDGSIVLMGGDGAGGYDYKNDVWRSTDNGATWIQVNSSAGWSPRLYHSSVVLPDGSIVLMGGYDGNFKNDVWRSMDNGVSWTQMTTSAGWSARYLHSSVAMPDGSIVLMGGYIFRNFPYLKTNDVWRSTDNGATWTQMTGSAEWSGRTYHSSVAMPDGSIVLIGGDDASGYKNDVWRSTNNGATWTQVSSSAGWSARLSHSSVAMPDGSIVLMGGASSDDVWRFQPAGSSAQNPSHTFTTPGTYEVALQVYNADGYTSTRKIGYIVVTNAMSNATSKIGVFLNGSWWLDYNGNGVWGGGDRQYTFGSPGVQAVTGDWNNDGRSELGVFLNGDWWLDYNGNGEWDGGDRQYTFGSPGVQAVTGDWNNDGRSELGVFLNGDWWLDYNGNGEWDGGDRQYTFGSPGVQAVTGDWNNDGRSELGVFLNGDWWLDYNGNGEWDGGDRQYTFGSPGVQAVTGDWNNDGRSELGVFLNGDWWLDYNGNGEWDGGDRQYTFEWSPGRIPVTGKWS